jgi:hypothetical protein
VRVVLGRIGHAGRPDRLRQLGLDRHVADRLAGLAARAQFLGEAQRLAQGVGGEAACAGLRPRPAGIPSRRRRSSKAPRLATTRLHGRRACSVGACGSRAQARRERSV